MMRIVFIVMFVLSASGFAEDNYENHLARLKPKAPEGFTIVVEKPFVVIGDEVAWFCRYFVISEGDMWVVSVNCCEVIACLSDAV